MLKSHKMSKILLEMLQGTYPPLSPNISQSTQQLMFTTHVSASTLCLKKNWIPATSCNNSNSPGSIAIDFDKNNR